MSEYSFWDNEGSQAIPQYQVYNIVKDYLNGGEIKDGACISEEGKKKKSAFYRLGRCKSGRNAQLVL